MSTGVKDDDAALGGLLNGGLHAGEVKALGLRQKVRVGFYGDVNVREDLMMVHPCRRGKVDGLLRRARQKPGKEKSTKMESSCARDCLEGSYLGCSN